LTDVREKLLRYERERIGKKERLRGTAAKDVRGKLPGRGMLTG
jgi:hypothetical protein